MFYSNLTDEDKYEGNEKPHVVDNCYQNIDIKKKDKFLPPTLIQRLSHLEIFSVKCQKIVTIFIPPWYKKYEGIIKVIKN